MLIRSLAFPFKVFQVAEPHQLSALFIPETEGEGLQDGEEGDGLDALEKGMGAVASLEVVIGNARAEMVNVMEADVAGKPLEYLRQFVEGTALQGGGGVIPFVGAL